jgi:hypothetical protein
MQKLRDARQSKGHAVRLSVNSLMAQAKALEEAEKSSALALDPTNLDTRSAFASILMF